MTRDGSQPTPARPTRGARDSAPPLPSGTSLVLVVDGDGVTRRFAELALARDPRLIVECVASAAAAFEVLRTQPCELVVTETKLPDLDGLELVRRLRARHRGDVLAIVVLSADDRVERKVAAFEVGADDYVVKPCPGEELRARLGRRVTQLRDERARANLRTPTLAGQLAALSLPDLVGVLAMARQTATLELHTERGEGAVFLDAGRVVHAAFQGLTGPRAFYHLFAESRGSFHLYDGCAAVEHTVHDSVTALVMEAARLLDTANAAGPAPAPAAVELAPRPPALPTSLHRLAPDRELALGFTRDITDPHTVATLALHTLPALGAWSRRQTRGARLLVALVAPALAGAAALASIASPPGERELAAAIDRDHHCLVAELRGREERELDIVLIELGHGEPFAQALGRRPDLVVLGGPDRELVPAWSHYLALLGLLSPPVVVTIGDVRFGHAVAGELASAPTPPRHVHRPADLAQPGELRRAITEGLRLWLQGGR